MSSPIGVWRDVTRYYTCAVIVAGLRRSKKERPLLAELFGTLVLFLPYS
jgi:hypothetical protein